MNARSFVDSWTSAEDYRGQVAHVEQIPARPASYSSIDPPLSQDLAAAFGTSGIERLYTHQAEAITRVRSGANVVVVTATASGKTLCYNAPVVEAVLANPSARALYLFPTKALAQDQLGKLNDLGLFPRVLFASYDGDTPRPDRALVRRSSHIVLSNPDMLHLGILPNHTEWSRFFTQLRFVVVDELHSYRGVFGAHVAQVLRRLRRTCKAYGSKPQFIACSGTIANPREHFRALTGEDATVVSENGAPCGPRTFVFWNPPQLESGARRSAHSEANALFTDLVANGVRTIAFARARKSAELLLRSARETLAKRGDNSAASVCAYRAGYTREQRREIERRLFDGDLVGITSTNALEMGIDVGGLDASLLTGYPGTIASAWQQAGRSGRGREESLSVLVGMDNPLDQYLMRHPEYFFGRPCERASADAGNARIRSSHLVCAAHEHPVSAADSVYFGEDIEVLLDAQADSGALNKRGDRWYCPGGDYPASSVNLRSASSEIYSLVLGGANGPCLGTVEGARVYSEAHPGAIYLHMGETYRVEHLDDIGKMATVRKVDLGYYTEPLESASLDVLSVLRSRELPGGRACLGTVVVRSGVVGFRTKRAQSSEVLSVTDLDLPEQVFETHSLWLEVGPRSVKHLADDGFSLPGSLHAAEHALIAMMPLATMCDRWDVGGVSSPMHPDTRCPSVFMYDAYPGGVGIAESAYEALDLLALTTQQLIEECGCDDGCPSCIHSPKCGSRNAVLDKRGAARLLRDLRRMADKEAVRA